MKKILGYTMLFLLMGTGMQAQDFDLGDIMGEAQDFFGEAQNDAEKAADTEAQRKFEEAFKNSFSEYAAYINELDQYSAEIKCLYLMFKYKRSYDELQDTTNATSDCRKKYDLYGMQLMTMMSSTSIIYCTGGLWELIGSPDINSPDLIKLDREILEILGEVKQEIINGIAPDVSMNMTDIQLEFMDAFVTDSRTPFRIVIAMILSKYFEPTTLLKNTIEISQKMDALKPCTGY